MKELGWLTCRVSSDPQAVIGKSLDAQDRVGRNDAKNKGIEIERVWRISESASKEDRRMFLEMCDLVKKRPDIKHLFFEKVDRFMRTYWKMEEVKELVFKHEKHIHFFVAGYILHKTASAETWLRFGIDLAVATHFSLNLSRETIKGLEEKARNGEWPGHAPCGFKNGYSDDVVKNVVREFEQSESVWVDRGFELMETSQYTLKSCREKLFAEGCPRKLLPWRSSLEKWIKNPFYRKWISYRGIEREGNHPRLISDDRWYRANAALARKLKPFHRQSAPYGGLLSCAVCGCSIVSELHKNRYRYYRCSHGKGRCANNKYYTEQEVEQMLEDALGAVHVDQELAEWITDILAQDAGKVMAKHQSQIAAKKAEITRLKKRNGKALELLLDGKFSHELWQDTNNESEEQKARLNAALQTLEATTPDSYMPTVRRTFELANKLPNILFSIEAEKRRYLLNLVLLNMKLDSKSLRFEYQKPFDLLAKMPENKSWGG